MTISMNSHRRNLRRAALRRRVLLDSLEPRFLLATGLPGISAVQFDMTTDPPQVEITFNASDVAQIDGTLAPLTGMSGDDNFSALLNLFDQVGDFEIDQVGKDGTFINQIVGPSNRPAMEYVSDASVAGTPSVQVAIPISGTALQPGHYQVSVEGSTTLALLFDAIEPGPAWDAVAASFQPLVIGQFAVHGQGASFQNASALPAPGSGVTTITGYLNPDDYRSAVDLYKFTLGPTPTNLWQFGVSVQAQSIGSPLQPDVTIFRADGSVVASRLSGTGLPANPSDPYLFAGLSSGTYYLGVSGAGNLPYGSKGYDPQLAIPGASGLKQPGGPFPFQLSFVAIPYSRPTTAIDAKLIWLDPLSSSPTNITLNFSGPIDLSNLFVVDQAQGALQLIDSANRAWPITANSYDPGTHQLNMLLDEPLPAGSYRLISPASNPLSDVVGQPVFAPGQPAGVFAAFTVAPPSGVSIPGNLGVLWPNQIGVSPSSIGDTFTESVHLAPGQAVTYRFVAVVAGLYKLQTVVDSGSLLIQQFGPSGMNTLNAGTTTRISNSIMRLASGVYGIRFADVSAQPAEFQWQLKIASVDWEKIVYNGVGQSAALALSLLSPPGAEPNPSAAPAPSIAGPVTFQAASVASGTSGPIPSNLLITLNTGLMGQPGSMAPAMASVGPAVNENSVALADGATGLIPGIRYESVFHTVSTESSSALAALKPPGSKGGPGEELRSKSAEGVENRLGPDASSILADQRALLQPEWLIRVAGMIRDWFGPASSEPAFLGSELDPGRTVTTVYAGLGAEAFASGPAQERNFPGKPAHADLEFPAGIIVIAIAAHRLRDRVRRLWRRKTAAKTPAQRVAALLYPCPHSASSFTRGKTRVRR
jgi:hypothetical protein